MRYISRGHVHSGRCEVSVAGRDIAGCHFGGDSTVDPVGVDTHSFENRHDSS